MWKKITSNHIVKGVLYFFPFQLLFLHLQRNQILLLFWLIILGFVSNTLAVGLGISYLFIVPEYLGTVNQYAYLVLGFAFGGFIMAFNISSYVINSHRFPFLAVLRSPFLKYCMNNCLVPGLVLIIYLFNMYHHLRYYELMKPLMVLTMLVFFMLGMLVFILVCSIYFQVFNKDFRNLFGNHPMTRDGQKLEELKIIRIRFLRKLIIAQVKRRSRHLDDWTVNAYFQHPFKISLVKEGENLDRAKLFLVFQQNHVTAAVFAMIVFISMLLLGWFRENRYFEFPAAASMLLLGTMGMMVAAMVHFFLRKWSTLFFISMVLALNWYSKHSDFRAINYAYGLDYDKPAIYDPVAIQQELEKSGSIQQDIAYHEEILDNWKKHAYKNSRPGSKPKMIFISCSGGGLKSALWTFYCLQVSDHLLDGKLLQNTVLITGSSGGMIGASYLRELYLQKQLGVIDNIYDSHWSENISKDILNPIASSIALNDLFLRMQYFTEGNYTYPKDRGYEFERKLNENTEFMLDKRLGDYTEYERVGIIPMMIFSPAITNDAKRLIISSQPVSFMSYNGMHGHSSPMIENIEFTRLFKDHHPYNLKFTSAIRMNATFPYVLPVVSLPSSPYLEIMDAGMRDNFGTRTGIQYAFHLKDWINKNTSGIIFIRISDGKRIDYEKQIHSSLLQDLLSPLGGLVGNVTKIHLQENDQLLQLLDEVMEVPVDVIDYRLGEVIKNKEIAMSFHLTPREQQKLKAAFDDKKIQDEILRLRKKFFQN